VTGDVPSQELIIEEPGPEPEISYSAKIINPAKKGDYSLKESVVDSQLYEICRSHCWSSGGSRGVSTVSTETPFKSLLRASSGFAGYEVCCTSERQKYH
jgi:hypothetical protein